jgi:hypothetical protein
MLYFEGDGNKVYYLVEMLISYCLHFLLNRSKRWKDMAKEVLRIGRLYMESMSSDIHIVLLDFDEKSNMVHGVEATFQPKQVFELLEALERHVSKMVRAKDCVTCVNFDDGCKLEPKQRVECTQNSKSLYIPAYPTA